jgi:glycosyltransferase involved in cell wall biosynthesis
VPLVSVIIPAYGHAGLILETLESVFAQSYRDFELIVINDGSPDDTAKVLAPLVESGRIRYFEQPNQGVAAARNYGISKAKGEFIALLDDDDLWPEDKLEWQIPFMRNPDVIAVGGKQECLTRHGIERYEALDGAVEEFHLKNFFECNPFVSPGQVLFRKSAYDQGARFDPGIWGADDLDFWMELTGHGKILRVGRLALRYRVHLSNTSRNQLGMMKNIQKTLDKRLPMISPASEIGWCREASRRWLYNYYFTPVTKNMLACFFSRKPQIRRGISTAMALAKTFIPAVVSDPWMRESIYKRLIQRAER